MLAVFSFWRRAISRWVCSFIVGGLVAACGVQRAGCGHQLLLTPLFASSSPTDVTVRLLCGGPLVISVSSGHGCKVTAINKRSIMCVTLQSVVDHCQSTAISKNEHQWPAVPWFNCLVAFKLITRDFWMCLLLFIICDKYNLLNKQVKCIILHNWGGSYVSFKLRLRSI